MAARLVRCIEGHVFDADAQEACPVCGAAADRGRVTNDGANGGDLPNQLSPSNPRHSAPASGPGPIPARLGLGLAGVAVILVGAGYWVVSRSPGPPVVPDRHDEQKQATPEKEKTAPPLNSPPRQEQPQPTASQPVPAIDPAASKPPATEGKGGQKGEAPKKPGLRIVLHPETKPCGPDARPDDVCSRTGQTPPDAPTVDYGDPKIVAAEKKLDLGNLARELLAAIRARRALARGEDKIAHLWGSSIAITNPVADYTLGRLLLFGKQVDRDVDAGLRKLQWAANNGSFRAALLLGQLYDKGDPNLGIPVDKERAGSWFQKALIDAPDKLAQDLRQEGYVLNPPAPTLLDLAAAKERNDFAKAFEIADNLARRGSVIAEYWRGYAFLKGLGVAKNISGAAVIILRCARNLEPNAVGLLGELVPSGFLIGAHSPIDALTFKLMARTFDHEDGVDGNDWDAGIQPILKSLDQEHYDALVAAVGDVVEVPAR
jgi:hypothetical protein